MRRTLVLLLVLLAPGTARAVDPFEIQVYDGTANAPGQPGVELHANSVIEGQKSAEPPELPLHRQSHLTLEPSIGVTRWLELGGYLQTAIHGDQFDWAGAKLRAKLVGASGRARFGVNFELSRLPETYDRDRWGGEIRPILAWDDKRWAFALNPILDVGFRGAAPSFEPALSALRVLDGVVSIGFEYYASFREHVHYLYEVANVLAWKRVEINFGVGEGLTAGSNAFVAKTIFGYSFDVDVR